MEDVLNVQVPKKQALQIQNFLKVTTLSETCRENRMCCTANTEETTINMRMHGFWKKNLQLFWLPENAEKHNTVQQYFCHMASGFQKMNLCCQCKKQSKMNLHRK